MPDINIHRYVIPIKKKTYSHSLFHTAYLGIFLLSDILYHKFIEATKALIMLPPNYFVRYPPRLE